MTAAPPSSQGTRSMRRAGHDRFYHAHDHGQQQHGDEPQPGLLPGGQGRDEQARRQGGEKPELEG